MARAAAAPDTWMPLWIGPYLANTLHLKRAQHGSYILLILAAWKDGGSLPDDDDTLATIARCSAKEWKDERATFAKFFKVECGLWVHERVVCELQKAAAFKAKQTQNGSQGGRPPKPKQNPNKTTTPTPIGEAPLGLPPDEYQISEPVAARESAEGARTHDTASMLANLGTLKRAVQ